MGRPDALSRQADHPRGAEDNADCTLLTLEVFELRVTEAVTLEGEEAIFMEWIRQSDQYDDLVVKALKALDTGELHSDEWTCAEGVVLYRGRVYVPDDPRLCHDLVHAHHTAAVAGHPGRWKMLELVLRNYWWPGLSRYITKFIAGCDACNWTKTFPMQKVGKLIPNKVPDQSWQVISVDMIGELPDSKGYNAVLILVDRLSKRIHTIPTVTSLDSAGVSQCKHLNSELRAQTVLHLSVSKGVIQRKRESQSNATSSSNDNCRPGPMAQAVHTGMKYVLFT